MKLDFKCHKLSQGNTNSGTSGIVINDGADRVQIIGPGTICNFSFSGIIAPPGPNGNNHVSVDNLIVQDCGYDETAAFPTAGGMLLTHTNELQITNCQAHHNYVNGIFIVNSSDVIVDHCQINETFGTATGANDLVVGLTVSAVNYGLGLGPSKNVCVRHTNVNDTNAADVLIAVDAANFQYTENLIIDSCNFNNTKLGDDATIGVNVVGIYCPRTDNVVIKNCVINKTTGHANARFVHAIQADESVDMVVDNTQVNNTTNGAQQCNGFHISGGNRVAKNIKLLCSKFNDSTAVPGRILTIPGQAVSGPFAVGGVSLTNVINVLVEDCEANGSFVDAHADDNPYGNFIKPVAFGYLLFASNSFPVGFPFYPDENRLVENVIFRNSHAYNQRNIRNFAGGFISTVGSYGTDITAMKNITFQNCIAKNNVCDDGLGGGILVGRGFVDLTPLFEPVNPNLPLGQIKNITVKECLTDDNGGLCPESGGIVMHGIQGGGVICSCDSVSNISRGITLNGTLNSPSNEAPFPFTSGDHPVGYTECFLVRCNEATNNQGTGFEDTHSTSGQNAFIDNTAFNNQPNFDIGRGPHRKNANLRKGDSYCC